MNQYHDKESNTSHWSTRLRLLWTVPLVALHASCAVLHAQEPSSVVQVDSLESEPERKRLGARMAIGGEYGLFGESFAEPRLRSIFGPRLTLLVPVGSQCDVAFAGSYAYIPGVSYSRPLTALEELDRQIYIALSAPNTPLPPTERTFTILPSRIVAFQTGVRTYARMMRPDALVSAMSPKFQRPFWRKRADRRGFHFGLYTGPVVGWHKRLIRTLPESWPVNEPIPESAVAKSEKTYQRWYWSGNFKLGWTFNGRVDLTLALCEVARFQGDANSATEESADAYAQEVFMGSLSVIFGRTGLHKR